MIWQNHRIITHLTERRWQTNVWSQSNKNTTQCGYRMRSFGPILCSALIPPPLSETSALYSLPFTLTPNPTLATTGLCYVCCLIPPPIPDSNEGWANVGPTSGRQCRRWANVGPTCIAVWDVCIYVVKHTDSASSVDSKSPVLQTAITILPVVARVVMT